MFASQWIPALATVLLVGHATLVVGSYLLARRLSTPRVDEQTDGDVVACPECGSTNERGYRYCRVCVTPLPDAVDFDERPRPPFGRLLR